jgi:hypothetical protein
VLERSSAHALSGSSDWGVASVAHALSLTSPESTGFVALGSSAAEVFTRAAWSSLGGGPLMQAQHGKTIAPVQKADRGNLT